MQLILSTENVRAAVFTNEAGQVLYKVHSPFTFEGTTTVYKVVPNTDPMDMQDRFEVMGEIEWRMIGSTTFRIGGKEMQSDAFLPKHGIMGRKRTFTGPDGRPYRWDMLLHQLVLSRDDESKTEVARYQRANVVASGTADPRAKPCLNVDDDVMHMLDLIVLTFIYVERLHMRKEQRSRGGGGSAPNDASCEVDQGFSPSESSDTDYPDAVEQKTDVLI